MKATINSYTHDPIKKDDLVYANDILELRANVEKLLVAFYNHIGTINPADGGACETDNNKREHTIVTTLSSGFAPRNIDNQLEKARQEFSNLMIAVKNDCYPELSVAIWYGEKVKSKDLPKGWLFCDGKEVLYTDASGMPVYTPDFTYTEIVAASTASGRELFSKTYAQKRECTGTEGSLENLGEGVSKWYIIKKPEESTPIPAITLTVTQPSYGFRIDTNYTSSGDITYLRSLQDGDVETNTNVPENIPLRYSVLQGLNSDVKLEALYLTHSKTGNSEVVLPPGRIITVKDDNLELHANIIPKEYTFTIKGTANQVITVVCNGVTHQGAGEDVIFRADSGEQWSATIEANSGFLPGRIIGETSGTITGNKVLSAEAAIPSTLTITSTISKSVSDNNYNGCILIGEEFVVDSPRTLSITLNYNTSGSASADSGWCWSGYGFTILPEEYYKTSQMLPNVWDSFSAGKNTGGSIPVNAAHPWTSYFAGSGAHNNFNGKCFGGVSKTSSSYHKYAASAQVTIPKGKSRLALVFNISASNGDGASFTASSISGSQYSCTATLSTI